MKKAETTNSFLKGMIMDLNPLTTPNDVLTNCLNGTIITFNGNEYVLLNDMGNGRVESAYLPEGYVPIGMKEHGGIVYVASYNPLTNKGLIGSFPSPERNLSSSEKDSNKEGDNPLTISWASNLYSDLIERYLLFKDSTVIRSGDKFSIIFLTEDSRDKLSKLISNLDNITTVNGVTKIKSPKNKFMTISVCVLDSSNNLLDITDLLLRLDSSSRIIDPISDIPEIKFNTGYFAEFVTDLDGKDVDDYRNLKAVNVYNNKLFGELFVLAKINAVDNIDVTVSGIRNKSGIDLPLSNYINTSNNYALINIDKEKGLYVLKNNYTLLMFEVTYEYNCPDGFYNTSSSSDLYVSDYGSEADFRYNDDTSFSEAIAGCILNIKGESITLPFKPDNYPEIPTFDYSTNTYKYTVIYGIVVNQSDGALNYTVTPVLNYTYKTDTGLDVLIKQDSIKVEGDIDLTLLGSGLATLSNFKYYWTSTNIDFSFKFDIYPKYGLTINSVIIKAYDLIAYGQDSNLNPSEETEENDHYKRIELTSRNSYNGTLNENIPTSRFSERRIYLFKFYYVTDEGTEVEIGSRVFINSAIFNLEYFTTDDFTSDIMSKFQTINIHSNINYNANSSLMDTGVHGVLMSSNDVEGNNTYTQSYLYDTLFNINNNLYIDHPLYYPFDFNSDAYTSSYTLSDFNANADITVYNSQGDSFKEDLLNFSEDNSISTSSTPKYKIDGTSIKVNAISLIKGTLTSSELDISSLLLPFINEQDGMYLFGLDGTLDYVSKFVGMEISHNLMIGEDDTDAHFYLYSITRSAVNTNGSPVQLEDYYKQDLQSIIPVSIYTGINRSDASYTDILLNAFGSSVFAFMCSTEMWEGNIQWIEGTSTGNWTRIKGCINPNYRATSDRTIADNMSAYLLKRWQLVWWRTASGQYTLVPYVYYFTIDPDLESSNATTILGKDIISLIKNAFKDIYLLLNVSSSVTAYVFNPDSTQYNDTYDLNISLNVTANLSGNQEEAFVIGILNYNNIIDNVKNKFQTEAEILEQYKFTSNTSSTSSLINYTIRISGTNNTYVNLKTMEANTLEKVFINDGNIITTDSTGSAFDYGKIYRLNGDDIEDWTNAPTYKALRAMEYNGKYTILAVPNRSINNSKFMTGWEYLSQSSPVYHVTLEDAPSIDMNSIVAPSINNLNMSRIQLDV